MLKLKA